MSAKYLIAFVICFFLSSIPLSARLGESEMDCVFRYGIKKRQENNENIFVKDQIEIRIIFTKDKATTIRFHKAKENFNEAEIILLLDANSEGKLWEKYEKEFKNDEEKSRRYDLERYGWRFTHWKRRDGVEATYMEYHGTEKVVNQSTLLLEKMDGSKTNSMNMKGF